MFRLLSVLAALAGAAPAQAADLPAGRSVQGRPLRAVLVGAADAPRRVLVVGAIHGDEPAGRAVVRALRDRKPPAGVQYVLVEDANPDGSAARTRTNARGVDLNRNFPHRWRAARSLRGRFWPGPNAGSEPETRWAMALIGRVRPQVSIWLHQPYGMVVDTPGADRALIRRYARTARLPVRRLPHYRGTVAGWQNARSGDAFVVEMRAQAPSAVAISRHVRAIEAVARTPAESGCTHKQCTAGVRPRLCVGCAGKHQAAPRPRIVHTPIPFPAKRQREMRRYAIRHYGMHRSRLVDPKVIVQHYTASTTFSSAFNTFAADVPDPELHELPGVCSHFVIDTDGTIHQLVPLAYMCRHTVGLNHTAFGIEHVGTGDGAVMDNPRVLRSSLALTRWLMARHGINRQDVIGHNESLSSPYHYERVARLRNQTHGDMRPATMRRYRRLL